MLVEIIHLIIMINILDMTPDNQYIGLSTPLDKITNEGEGISPKSNGY